MLESKSYESKIKPEKSKETNIKINTEKFQEIKQSIFYFFIGPDRGQYSSNIENHELKRLIISKGSC